VLTTSVHGKARIVNITPGRVENSIAEGNVAIVAGFQGVSPDTKDITTLGRGWLGHHRGGSGRQL